MFLRDYEMCVICMICYEDFGEWTM